MENIAFWVGGIVFAWVAMPKKAEKKKLENAQWGGFKIGKTKDENRVSSQRGCRSFFRWRVTRKKERKIGESQGTNQGVLSAGAFFIQKKTYTIQPFCSFTGTATRSSEGAGIHGK